MYALLDLFDVSCFIKYVTGVSCPGCGMTHALMKALTFDFREAFRYHPMFWSVPVLFLYFFKDGVLFKNKILNLGVFIAILSGFMVNWIYKLV